MGRHNRKSGVPVMRWVQLVLGVFLTYVGLALTGSYVAKGSEANGDMSAPLWMAFGVILIVVGVATLINLLVWIFKG